MVLKLWWVAESPEEFAENTKTWAPSYFSKPGLCMLYYLSRWFWYASKVEELVPYWVFTVSRSIWEHIIISKGMTPKSWSWNNAKITAVFFLLVVVQLLTCIWLFATPWIAAHQASLSFTSCQSLLKLMSIESVMPSNHLILCYPLLLLPRNKRHAGTSPQWACLLIQQLAELWSYLLSGWSTSFGVKQIWVWICF